MTVNQDLLNMWDDSFMPFSLGLAASFQWLIRSFVKVFEGPLNLFYAEAGAILFLLGCIKVFQRDRERFSLWVTPILLVIIAACVGKYPLQGRLLLFLTPVFFILISEGLESFFAHQRRIYPYVGIVLAGLLLAHPVKQSFYDLTHKRTIEENRVVLNYLKMQFQKGDFVFYNNSAQYAFFYYVTSLKLPVIELEGKQVGAYFGCDIAKIFDQSDFYKGKQYMAYRYEQLFFRQGRFAGLIRGDKRSNTVKFISQNLDWQGKDHKRIWLFLSHLQSKPKKFLLDYFDSVATRRDKREGHGAGVYLYEFKS
nr:hypothetical protein [uncultured bacterium]